MKTCFILALAVFTSLALVVPAIAQQQPADEQEISDEALREMIYNYGDGVGGSDGYKSIAVHGARVQDAVFDVLLTVRYETRATGTRPKSLYDPDRVLLLLNKVDAPIPVDRLCEFVEQCPIPSCQDAALHLLAQSGHPKGLAYIEYVRDCAAKSFDPEDHETVSLLNDYIKAWEKNNVYVRTGGLGEVLLGEKAFEPSAATKATRRAYEENPQLLAWEGAIDNAYLSQQLPKVLPLLWDETHATIGISSTIGQFYEPVLAPLLLDWHEGRTQPLESLMGRPLVDPQRANPRIREDKLSSLISMMTGDIALGIKKDIVLNSKAGPRGGPIATDRSHMFLCHDPEKWVGELISRGLADSGRPETRAFVILLGLNGLERPLTENERAQLPALLTQPRVNIIHSPDWLRGEKDAGLRPLARREPQAFRAALNAQHLGTAVIDAILAEKTYDDKQVVFDRIEYAMLHDRERANRPRPAAAEQILINDDWFDLVVKDLRDDPDALKFLQRLAGKKEFEGYKNTIDRYMQELLKRHPEWQ